MADIQHLPQLILYCTAPTSTWIENNKIIRFFIINIIIRDVQTAVNAIKVKVNKVVYINILEEEAKLQKQLNKNRILTTINY